ncbi:hypothetical protein BC938DRAFT_481354, partial [Jimgerdemannia flammicorona]
SRGSQGVEDQNPGNNLFVNGLSIKTTNADLEEFFSKYGKVEKAEIMYDPHSRDSRGFAFIRMDTNEDAVRAIEGASGSELNGRAMSVEKAKRGRPRTPTPGRYYGPPKRRGEEGSPPKSSGGSRRYIDRFDPRYDAPRYYDPRYERDPRPSRYDPRYDRFYDRPSYLDRGYEPRYDRGGAGYDGGRDRGYDRYDRERRPQARYDPYARPRSPY